MRIIGKLLLICAAAGGSFAILYSWNYGVEYLLWLIVVLAIGFLGCALED